MTQQINRRAFLRGSGALALTSLAAGVAQAQPCRPEPKWDRTVDVLVVGSGFSGLAAAIEARTNGADV